MAIIEAEHLTKEYRLGQFESLKTTFLNQIRRITGQPLEQRALFKALDDVSFSVDEGEVLGIIGHNGAGKSTLLKLLARITAPTSGRIHVGGRIAPLIEVGAGFVPNLTGRENVYLNGAILGLSRREISHKFDEIVEFAEMEEFIDTPVKRYSSGMQVKLAFSVATSIDAEILIVDEVLAVGDLAFQQKCIERMETLIKGDGRTVIIVGHNIRQLERICSRMLLMDHGSISLDGAPNKVCGTFYQQSQQRTFARHRHIDGEILPQRDTGLIKVTSVELFDDDGNSVEGAGMHESLNIAVRFTCAKPIAYPEIVIGFKTPDFVQILSVSNLITDERPTLAKGPNEVICHLANLPLRPFIYSLRLGFLDQYRQMIWYAEDIRSILVSPGRYDVTLMPTLGLIDIPTKWTFSFPIEASSRNSGPDLTPGHSAGATPL